MAVDEDLAEVSGEFFANCKITKAAPQAYCNKDGKLIWEHSINACKISDKEFGSILSTENLKKTKNIIAIIQTHCLSFKMHLFLDKSNKTGYTYIPTKVTDDKMRKKNNSPAQKPRSPFLKDLFQRFSVHIIESNAR